MMAVLITSLHCVMQDSQKGFTLIELLVIVAIIGILATVVLQHVLKPRDAALLASYKQSMQSVRTAAELCTGTGGTLYTGVTAAGGTICSGRPEAFPDIEKCGSPSFIVQQNSQYDWAVTTSASCAGCRIVCSVDECTAGAEDTLGACKL